MFRLTSLRAENRAPSSKGPRKQIGQDLTVAQHGVREREVEDVRSPSVQYTQEVATAARVPGLHT